MDVPLYVVLDPQPGSSSRARQQLAQHFADSVREGRMSTGALLDVKLVVSELVANAIMHGDGAITLKVSLAGDGGVRIEVYDQGTNDWPLVRPIPGPSGGWGLRIVDRLAAEWGLTNSPATGVWAELPAVAS
jgi:anti-sigma regulatory factor (Ser/Thr protein kinase)